VKSFLFLKKRSKKPSRALRALWPVAHAKRGKVFCFFFSKKQRFLFDYAFP
jgi:hypothetical protein